MTTFGGEPIESTADPARRGLVEEDVIPRFTLHSFWYEIKFYWHSMSKGINKDLQLHPKSLNKQDSNIKLYIFQN